jgi:DNA-binding transcriptional regulator YhcF (GntR family)
MPEPLPPLAPSWSEREMAPVNEQSSTEIIKRALLTRILNGTFGVDERLNENRIANEFNVSRGPVREALRSLEEARLVTSVRNRGVFVRKVDIEEALHLYDVRAGLAYVAGGLLAQRATAEQIKMLFAYFESMERERKQHNTEAYFEINEKFHRDPPSHRTLRGHRPRAQSVLAPGRGGTVPTPNLERAAQGAARMYRRGRRKRCFGGFLYTRRHREAQSPR